MITKLRANIIVSKVKKFLGPFGLPLLFVIIVVLFYPGRTQFQTGADEGINLMKAMLVDNGYTLYDDIWSDQPPLFTHFLAAGFHFVGYKVGFARYIVLIFSAVLLWAAGRFLHLVWGKKISIIGSILIMLLPAFLSLSVSVLIGLPSISFAMVSLWALAEWHSSRKYTWLVISALFMSLSVLTKIFLGFLGPIFCLGLLLGEFNHAGRKIKTSILLPSLVWGLIFSIILVSSAFFWVGTENMNQLWDNHVLASTSEVLIDRASGINYYLKNASAFVILSMIGIYDAIRERKWLVLYTLVWAASAYFLLLNHSPVWSHHQLIVTIPLALLAAPTATKAFLKLREIMGQEFSLNVSSAFQIIAILSFLAILLPFKLPENFRMLSLVPASNPETGMYEWEKMFMRQMALYKPQTNWIITDMPIYAFRNRITVPPEIAVFSQKRLETGEITEADVINLIETYQPEQVFIGRFDLPEVERYLQDHYLQVYYRGDMYLYIRSDIEEISIESNSP